MGTLRRIKFKYGSGNTGVRYKTTNSIKRNRNNVEMGGGGCSRSPGRKINAFRRFS